MRWNDWKFAPRRICAAILLGALAPAVHTQAQFVNRDARLGTNLAPISNYSRAIVFVDLFKESDPWIHQSPDEWQVGDPLELTKYRYPARIPDQRYAGTVIKAAVEGHYPGGRYRLLWDGDGVITVPGAPFDPTDAITSRSLRLNRQGELWIDVAPRNVGVLIRLEEVNPENPIRNVRFIVPGFAETHERQTFHPTFLEGLEPYRVIRFAEWQRIRNNPTQSWHERTTTSHSTQNTDYGVAPEYMIALCNATASDPWFSMPLFARDDYIREFARLAKKRLNPDLRVIVEFGHEVWKPPADTSQYAVAQGLLAYPGLTPGEARMRWYIDRSTEVFKIWEESFGEGDRLVRVISTNWADEFMTANMLEWLKIKAEVEAAADSDSDADAENTEDVPVAADALAIASFFGGELGDPRQIEFLGFDPSQAGEEEILNWTEGLIEQKRTTTQNFRALADEYGLDLFAYAGGPHLMPMDVGSLGNWRSNPGIVDTFVKANRHPRMNEIYLTHLKNWVEDGGDLFVHYMHVGMPYGDAGCFSVRESYDDPITPREAALYEFAGVPLPARTNASGGSEAD